MNITCTGGAGFIGSHLVDRLLAADHTVAIFDNMGRGQNLPAPGQWTLCQQNLLRPWYDWQYAMRGDVVFHLAAKVTGIEFNRFHHYDMQHTNEMINLNVMEAVRRARPMPKLFIFTSTACIYSPDAPVPTPESAGEIGDPEKSNWGYGVAKWSGEQLAKSLCREYGIATIIVRFWNAFGPRDHYDDESSHVAPALIKRVLDGENPVVVWGSGEQTRALVDARDIATALVKLMDWGIEHAPIEPVIVNIGHEREVSIRELAETIVRLSGKAPVLRFDTTKPDGYPRRAADTTRLRQMIGWVPDMPLEQTLRDMIYEYQGQSLDWV